MLITLKCEPTGWTATFTGGTMPQDVALPLPWTHEASVITVRNDLQQRFPYSVIVGG